MSYELKNAQTLGDNLRRICRKQIEAAIAVAAGEKKSSDTPVHEVRKHLKKARAALRLIRKEIGHGLFREQDRCLRNVGRLTSEIRDAEVRLQNGKLRRSRCWNRRLRTSIAGRSINLIASNFAARFKGPTKAQEKLSPWRKRPPPSKIFISSAPEQKDSGTSCVSCDRSIRLCSRI